MENEKFQELVLKQFELMNNRLDNLQKDVAGVQQDITGVKQDVTDVKQEVSSLKQDVAGIKQSQTRMELDFGRKLGLLLDGFQSHTERLDRIENKIDKLDEKTESHDIKIAVLDRRRKAKGV